MNGRALFKGGNVVVRQVYDVTQRVEGILNVVDLFRHHFYLINGAVKGERNSVTVINDAATGGDRHQFDAVFVRASLIISKANDLQIIKVGDQHAGEQQNPQKATSARRTNSADSAE